MNRYMAAPGIMLLVLLHLQLIFRSNSRFSYLPSCSSSARSG